MIKLMIAIVMMAALSGCSATSALTGLIGSKPEISAQAGAENVKQTVGVTGKVDKSSETETTIKDSAVGKVDTSTSKKQTASSIKADTIIAERIEISNGGEDLWHGVLAIIAGIAVMFLPLLFLRGRKDKGA